MQKKSEKENKNTKEQTRLVLCVALSELQAAGWDCVKPRAPTLEPCYWANTLGKKLNFI